MNDKLWEQYEEIPADEIAAGAETKMNYDLWNQYEVEQNSADSKWGDTVMYSAPERNILTDMRDCLNWVNRTRMSAFQEGKDTTETARLEIKDMAGRITPYERKRLEELNNRTPVDYGIIDYAVEIPSNFIPRIGNGIKKAYVRALSMLPYMFETMKAGGIGTAQPAGQQVRQSVRLQVL